MDLTMLLIALVFGIAAALVGGALSGVRLAGADLGNELAAFMGSLYGVLSGTLAVVIGLGVVVALAGGL
ncbi:MAG TPA: hypothetical protein DIW51_08625 [Rhodospirillaceae bacterium]|nr:hypothetical protein [Magnetovibrio sp.]MBO6521067.1 hypothetical protein [Rhodospirillales bacterium]MDW3206136.1 hypothetical protein [Alphaproteobacteria bacterium]HCS70020.1 hypothetical protein [Rhodospirillaceae bacterium]|tara:strand:- start:351 stop:557 length:207 start_codon:yes stop_codon:yes gene_type:complete